MKHGSKLDGWDVITDTKYSSRHVDAAGNSREADGFHG